MKQTIDEVAKILMYTGPSMSELISSSVKENKEIDITKQDGSTYLSISFETAYSTKVNDIYVYNCDNELIKQEIEINNKVTVIFDKFKEASELLQTHKKSKLIAS